jgi:hypothetical protein
MSEETVRRQLVQGWVQGWREAGAGDRRLGFFLYLTVGIAAAMGAALALR